jgi:uncharacterized membrane protein
MSLCKYSKIFGEPNQGVHGYRFLNLAIVDVVFTILGGIVLQQSFFKKRSQYIIIISLFILGIIMHRLFCVRTTIDKLLF